MWHKVDPFNRRVAVVSLALYFSGALPAIADTVAPPPVALPPGIQIHAELRPAIAAMQQASHTFRRQYERILTTPRLIVHARLSRALVDGSIRARSMIRRYDSGLLVVLMEIGPGVGQHEWIAHEFEHVLEQIDGLQLSASVGRLAFGTWHSGAGMFETSRAVRAGQTVMVEMRERGRRSDKYVE